ncbi:MAG: Uma2 family endonuclease, partial [Cylindrospermopsis raciborskii PAMP2011]|nr:Uma2 family endonuclease [Cylindrospermopsis raciborskii PAMP2011]
WATLEGELLPTQQEKIQREYERREIAEALVIQERQEKEIAQALAIQERQEKEIAQALAIQERQKNEKLAVYLRSLGINPDEI